VTRAAVWRGKVVLKGSSGHENQHVSLALMGTAQRRLVEDNDSDWMRAHTALSRLAKTRALADAEEGRWLLAARRASAHVHLGFGSFGEYVERLFGYTARSTQEKLRVAEELPELTRALESGALSWSALRELTRVAVPDTEQQWRELAQGKTVRQLEELVAGKSAGDTPGAAGLPSARRHVLRFEVAPETFALFREALSCLRRHGGDVGDVGDVGDDDSLLLSMARHVLGGPTDERRSSYQIALAVCPACGAAEQRASGELVPVGAEVIAMAHCDSQQLGHIAPRAANQNAAVGLDVNASSDGAASPRVHETPKVHGDGASLSISSTPTDKPLLESAPVDAPAQAPASGACAAHPEPPARAKQSIPPALRRAVLLRDKHRCQVGRNTTFLDLHHIQLRSEGGRHELGNMLTLCGCHHRATHRGSLLIEKDPQGGVVFRHADGSLYGHALEPQALQAQAKLFSALRHLGFKEREGRVVLTDLRADPGLRGASLQDQLREALRRLHPPQPRP
jgi:hypothetical protein